MLVTTGRPACGPEEEGGIGIKQARAVQGDGIAPRALLRDNGRILAQHAGPL